MSLPLQLDAHGQLLEIETRSDYLNTEQFRTFGLLTQEIGSDVRVFVSHSYWQAAQQCWVERVSMLELTCCNSSRRGGP